MSEHRNNVANAVSGTPGTGTITLGSAVTGSQSFAMAYGANATVDVFITDGTAWEVARACTYTHSGTTLTRGTLEASSTGSALSLTSAALVRVAASADSGRRWDAAALEHSTVTGTSGALTAEVNTLYVADMSAWAADRTITLPAAAKVGDRVGFLVEAGSLDFEWLITAASGDALNGVAGGTEWSRIFATGEYVYCRCVVENTTWVVESDGRKPIWVQANGSGFTSQTLTRNTFSQITTALSGTANDPWNQWDAVNYRIVPRRSGRWELRGMVTIASVQSPRPVSAYIRKSTGTILTLGPTALGNGTVSVGSATTAQSSLVVGDLMELWCYYEEGTATNRATVAQPYHNYFNAAWLGD